VTTPRRLTLPLGSALLALLALLCQTGYVGSSPSPIGQSTTDPQANAQGVASPCATTSSAADPGTPVDSNNLTVTLEQADFHVGPNVLAVQVTRGDGTAMTGAVVIVEIRMPSMDHGVSAYPASEQADGMYQAHDVSLGMAGEWEVTVQVIRQARAPAEAAYRVEVEG